MAIRNWMFDIGLLKSTSFEHPIISVGNLSMGGTGKSPHIEFLIRKLKKDLTIATLSRGYGRTSKGYLEIQQSSNVKESGDEPLQFKKKFPDVKVIVDENRKHAIVSLLKEQNPVDVILLDDAFQHRRVNPGLNILLTDYSNSYQDDFVFPSGKLREWKSGAKRADIIIVTKSPTVLSPIEIRRIEDSLKPLPHQKIYFSYINYLSLKPLNEAAKILEKTHIELSKYGVLLVTAIANPIPLNFYLKRYVKELHELKFRDHHFFSSSDYQKIENKLDSILGNNKLIVITEKDSMRFDPNKVESVPVFYLPIGVSFHANGEEKLMVQIREYLSSF